MVFRVGRPACFLPLFSLLVASAALIAAEGERSHRERFADPRAVRERIEREASVRLQTNPDDVTALLERGTARLQLGRIDEALEDLERAAAADLADARAQLAYALWLRGRLAEAQAAARAVLERNPDHSAAHYYAGRLLLQTGEDLAQAVHHLERAVQLNPAATEMLFDVFAAYRRVGDAERAGAQLRLLRSTFPPRDARVVYAEGLLASDLGHLGVAVERFRRAVESNPQLTPARYDLGIALIKLERWAEAGEVLRGLAQVQPQSFEAAYFHALALHNLQQGAEAEAEVRRALELNAQGAEAHTLLGIVLATRSAYDDAVRHLETALGLDPDSFDAQFYLGRTYYALRNYAASREVLGAAAARQPGHAEVRFFLATVLERLGEREAALEHYRMLVEQHPSDPRGYVGLGSIQAKYGQLEEALASLRQALELAPHNFEAALSLGRVYRRQGETDLAIAALRQATALVPESPEAHYQLGLALQRAGRQQEAQQEFDIVDRLNRKYRSGGGMESDPAGPSGR